MSVFFKLQRSLFLTLKQCMLGSFVYVKPSFNELSELQQFTDSTHDFKSKETEFTSRVPSLVWHQKHFG